MKLSMIGSPVTLKEQILANLKKVPYMSLLSEKSNDTLLSLTYVSKPTYYLDQKGRDDLVEHARKKNLERSITGVLFLTDKVYLQTIEGPALNILELLEALKKDTRHHHVTVTHLKVITERKYPQWSMGTLPLNSEAYYIMENMLNAIISSYDILKCYTQHSVIEYLANGVNPTRLRPQRVEKVILFSDIVSFSTIAECLDDPETILQFVNVFLQTFCEVVTNHGGEVSKFIGDCGLATFKVEHVNQAVSAGIEIHKRLCNVRWSSPSASPLKVLNCGSGLSYGEVIEGNIGCYPSKLDYTYLGSVVNIAARLEHATREYKVPVLLTAKVKDLTEMHQDSAYPRAGFEEVGVLELHNLRRQVHVYSPLETNVADFRRCFTEIPNWIDRHTKIVQQDTNTQ